MTIFGKCQIINSLIVSKLLYVATVLEYPEQNTIKQINRIIFSFLWGNRERIKRKTLIQPISEGGIAITDFELKIKAIKAAWVSKLVQSDNVLNKLINSCIRRYNLDIAYLLNTNVTKTGDLNIKHLPNFYKEVICAFNECKSNGQEKLQIQNIWFNKNITYKGKPLFFPAWAKSGQIFVNDVIDANGFLTLEEIKNTLKTTNNYLCEYITVKSALQKYASNSNLRDSAKRRHLKFVFNFQGHIKSIERQK